MAMKRKGWIALAILAGVVLLVIVGSLGSRSKGTEVTISTVASRTVRSSILAGGQLMFSDPVQLKPQVIGRISSISVKEGQRVKAGAVVLRLDPQTYQAAVDQASAGVKQAQTSIESQKLTVLNLARQVARQRTLFKRGLVDANSFDNLQNQLAIARVQQASAEQSLSIAEARLNQAQQDLAKTVINSPIDGMITSLPVKVGETVIAGTNIPGATLMTIANPAQIIADVQVDEADIANVKLGTKAQIHAVSYPNQTLHGKVIFIASSVTNNALTANSGRTFEVKIALQGKDLPHILPGMSCRVEIYTRSASNTLAVPIQAVLYKNKPGAKNLEPTGGAYVFVMRKGKARKLKVTTGISSDTWQAIDKGLKPGEKVITGPYLTLHSLTAGQDIVAKVSKKTSSTDTHTAKLSKKPAKSGS